MTTNNPDRFTFGGMCSRGSNEVVLLDPGSYPGVSRYLNKTFEFASGDWTVGTSSFSAGPLPARAKFGLCYDGYQIMVAGGQADSETGGVLTTCARYDGTTWTSTTSLPYGRFNCQMVLLNTAAPKAIMFGGETQSEILAGTYTWNGHGSSLSWTAFGGAEPPARTKFQMSGGPVNCVVFSGAGTNQLLTDCWSFNGTTWTRRSPTGSPPPRMNGCMAYDVANSRYILFGGQNESGEALSPVTYALAADFSAWTVVNSTFTPPGLIGASMCYDVAAGTIIMTGGMKIGADYAEQSTYRLTNSDWAQI